MSKRVFDPSCPELMDRPQPVNDDLEASLKSLIELNRWFGGRRITRFFLERWLAGKKRARVLDVATGAGDLPREMARWGRANGVEMTIDAVDMHPATLEIARKWMGSAFPEIRLSLGDALNAGWSPPAGEEGYDVVFCSLALHHFTEEDAARLLGRLRGWAGAEGRVAVPDLERSGFSTWAIGLVTATIFRHPMTVHDARASAAAAFSAPELRELARAAGWERAGWRRFAPARQAVWLD